MTPADDHNQAKRQFGLRYLFVVTTWIGVGAALAFNSLLIPPVRSVGLGICNYWVAKAFFVVSTRLPRIGREIAFLAGFPFFISSMLLVLVGIVGTIAHFMRPF